MSSPRRKTLQTLPIDAPAGTLVLVVEDDHTITFTRTRTEPWPLHLLGPRGERVVHVVALYRRSGSIIVSRCFLPPLTAPMTAFDLWAEHKKIEREESEI